MWKTNSTRGVTESVNTKCRLTEQRHLECSLPCYWLCGFWGCRIYGQGACQSSRLNAGDGLFMFIH